MMTAFRIWIAVGMAGIGGGLWAIDYEPVGPGPWGELERRSVYLYPPDEVLRIVDMPSEVTEWIFPGQTQAGLEEELKRLGVSDEQVRTLMRKEEIIDNGEEVRLYPDGQFLVDLDPNLRSRLYGRLRGWPENVFHVQPFVMEQKGAPAWLENLGLPENLIKLVGALSYQRGQSLLFSDLPVLLSQCRTNEDEGKLMRGLTRARTLKLRLKIGANLDWARLENYWLAGGLNEQCQPLLESIRDVESIETIDVEQLLPRWPRKYVHAYPRISDGMSGRYPDGVYSSLNFFRAQPIPVYGDSPGLMQTIEAKYRRAEKPYRFGDVMLLLDERGSVVHACVYMVENVVFTKNRTSILSPWVMSQVSEMIQHHSYRGAVTLRVLRDRRIADTASEDGVLPATGVVVP